MDEKTSKLARNRAKILSIWVDSTSKGLVLRFVRSSLENKRKFYIVTPNPEIVNLAQSDTNLAKILNSADLALPDGKGLVFAAQFLGQPKLNLIRGREMFLELCRLANKKGWRIFLLGGGADESQKTKEILERGLKNIKIESLAGPILDRNANPVNPAEFRNEIEAVETINAFAPQLLFVAFGAPKQEKWIAKWLPRLNIGGAMAVGGTFRYLAGKSKLPPKWMEEVGLEWLWRLSREPWRFGRIVKAIILFPIRVFFSALFK